jgi:hypothetical protein
MTELSYSETLDRQVALVDLDDDTPKDGASLPDRQLLVYVMLHTPHAIELFQRDILAQDDVDRVVELSRQLSEALTKEADELQDYSDKRSGQNVLSFPE